VDAAARLRLYSQDVERLLGLRTADWTVPVALAAVATVEVVSVRPPHPALTTALEWSAALLLVVRRRWPLAVCTLAGVLVLVPLTGAAADDLTAPVLLVGLAGYSLGRWLPDLRGSAVMVLFLALVFRDVFSGRPANVGDVVWVSTLLLPPYGVGVLVRALDARNRRLAEDRERAAEEAAAAERGRIARELHDVLAHSVSAMVLQAAAAEDVVHTDPDRAASLLRQVTTVGRQALIETGQLLRLVRDPDDELGLRPGPGLGQLDDLIAGAREAGLEVEFTAVGQLTGLPAALDLSAYRIVQEALTNAGKHGAGSASLRVARALDQLEIVTENAMTASATSAAGGGLGLVGMAERIAAFGGHLEHGPTAAGTYRLAITLPLPPEPTCHPAAGSLDGHGSDRR
jgi:signal transduction histidine kinase